MTTGIYQIQSKIKPARIYIGSAKDIHSRWKTHLSSLKNGRHHSIKLQNHYNKYGGSDLQFSILLGCDKNDLIKVEQYFLDSYKPWFNMAPKASGGQSGKSHFIAICQYDKQGNFIKEWGSIIEASRKLNIKGTDICTFCKRGGSYGKKSIGGFLWKYKFDKSDLAEYTDFSHNNKKGVLQFDLNGNFLKAWESSSEAEKKLGIDRSSIQRCADGKRNYKMAGGFVWKRS